jgi:two-component system, sensor histidine kinase and response regulator
MASPGAGKTGNVIPELSLIAAAFDALPTPALIADRRGAVRWVNRALSSLTGFTADELAGDAASVDFGLGDVFRGVLRSGEKWEGAWMCPRKSAAAFEARLSVAPVGSGSEALVVATIDAAVRNAVEPGPGERDFELFFNLIPDLACIAHQDGYFKRVNPAWEKTLGYTPEEVLSRPFVEFVHPDDAVSTMEEAGRQSRIYRTRHFINRYRAKDGSYRLLEWTTTFNRDEVTRFGVARDITAQRKWEESLRESEERFRIMADSCPTIIWVTGPDGEIRLTNRTCREFFGPEFEHADFPAASSLIHPEDRDGYVGRFHEAVQGRTSFRGEARVRRADGEWRWIASYAEPRRGASGEFLGHVGISPDFTERKEAEDALHDAKLAAEAANRAKGEFLANMSHEIRTPMNAVIGLTDLALGTELNAEQRSYLGGVKDSAESLLRILNDILDFSKIEAGKLEFETIEFDVRQLVEAAAKLLGFRAASKGLELAAEVAPDVPSRALGDPARLRQILVNLVGNAIKFTERGEVVVRVECESRTGAQAELHFTVRDTGIGIPSDKQQLVFSPFAQADSSTTRRFGGTGLGLTISSQLVELMNGRMWVESEEGRGSTFHFTARLGVGAASEHGDGSRRDALAGLAVLVADDNGSNREILGRILTRAGCRTTHCDCGEGALRVLREAADSGRPYSLLVLDQEMADLDGAAVMQRIQADPDLAALRVALLNSGRPGEAARARELGALVCLSKPVGEIELIEALGRAWVQQTASEFAPDSAPAQERGGGRPLRILVVEDNPVNRLLATRLIEKQGHVVAAATNGQEALNRLEAETFDCVLMDVQMPVMDGFEATAAIRRMERESGASLPVIAMTAHAMAGDLERCLAAGMDGYVTKPVNSGDLFAAIEDAMRKWRSPRER